MEELIASIYPEDSQAVLDGITDLKSRYRDKLQVEKKAGLSHKDCILITYGDAIYEEQETPLATLAKFAENYLKEGISAIHLLPCFPYSSDDGFSVIDYYEINPELGTWEHIEELESHFELMFDAVVNHISKESDWFWEFLEDKQPFNEYFIEADPKKDYSRVVRPRALPLLHPFVKKGEEVFVWTTFSEDQVDLNYANYKVFLQVLDILLYYISKGARYIRLDAIAFLWKEEGTSCIHLDQTHGVIQAYRRVLDQLAPEAVIITETNVPHEENISYFGDGTNEAHMVYNFTLPPLLAYSIHQKDVSVLAEWACSLELPGKEVCFFNFTASHDGVGVRPLQGIIAVEEIQKLADLALKHGGFVSYKNNEDGSQSPYELNCNYMDLITDPKWPQPLRIQRFLLTQSVMLCMPGVPGIYYHSILGSENDREAALQSGINRRINRKKLDLNILETELKERESMRKTVFEEYSRLLQIRHREKVFHPFGSAKYSSKDSLFIIIREYEGEQVFAVHNFSDLDMTIKALAANCVDLISGDNFQEAHWTLAPFEFKWFKKS